MSNKGKKDMASAAAQAAAQAAALAAAGIGNSNATSGQYDPATLLALYSMSNAYGSAFATGASSSQPSSSPSSSGKATPTSTATSAQGFGGLGALAAAAGIVGGAGGAGAGASGGASVSSASANNSAQQQANQQWWAMAASQYAAQEYMARIQAATRDPAAYAVLAAQGVVPNYQMLSQGSKSSSSGSGRKSTQSPSLSSLKLPSDTEIIKYTSSVTGSKDPGSSNRGRKKTISLDSNLTTSDYAALAANISGSSNDITPPIPAGLTIERKKKNSGSNERSSPMVDRVEITKIPVSNGTPSPVPPASSNFKSSTPKAGAAVDSPLNLSMKSPMGSGSADNSGIYTSKSIGGSKIPQEYYASQALSGVFLAEQIRQQQLAAALESRLDAQSFNAMQTAMLMNKLTKGAAVADTTKLLLEAAAASEKKQNNSKSKTKAGKGKAAKNNFGLGGDKLNRNTVASLLAKSRELSCGTNLTPEELEQAERSALQQPELTIEPIFRNLKPDQSVQSGDDFDTSDNGRRLTSVMEDGKLKIKTVSDSPEIRNLSDHEGSASDSDDGRHPSKYATVETEELKLPLQCGWKRETTVREYSKSGLRGDVIYYAPCGKKFKQYPDIMRYLEKNGVKNLLREHFSFSTKVFIGDFLKPTGMCSTDGDETYAKLTAKEMYDDVDKLRRENGWKPRRRGSKTTSTATASKEDSSKTASVSITSTTSGGGASSNQAALAESLLQRLQAEAGFGQADLQLQREALSRILQEASRLEKLEQARREKEAKQQALQEAKRKRQEEAQRLKQEEQMRRVQEREQKRQQAALMKEQAKQYEQLLYQQNAEREKRRQHMILMKQLEAKKRLDEREKKKDELRLRAEIEKEKRTEQKRLELEVINELRKPIEDMSLEDHKPLPELKRIPGLRLSGEAFANILMVYEFLHNFGETLGFDMDSLPSMNSFQAALLYDQEAEEELLSVLIHLLVCAIEDPGIPHPHKHLTLLGQNLRQADITNTNVSEILRIYLNARGHMEVKFLHNMISPEMLHTKDPRRESLVNPQKIEEFNELLRETKGYMMAQWVKDKSYLCLNPTEKAEILAFICNELLYNKAVVHQIDTNVENIGKAKKEKWEAEANLKRLKVIHVKKTRAASIAQAAAAAIEDASANNSNHVVNESEATSEVDDSMSTVSENTQDGTPVKKRNNRSAVKKPAPSGNKDKGKKNDPPEEDAEESMDQPSVSEPMDTTEDNEDEKLTLEELQKKIDKAGKKLSKKREELAFTNNRVRCHELGQDRYRRRYHHFAHAGGIFVEAIESAEPWKLSGRGMPHYDEDGRMEVGVKTVQGVLGSGEDKKKVIDVVDLDDEPSPDVNGDAASDHDDKENDDENSKEAVVKTNAEEDVKMETEEDKKKIETENALKKLGSEIMVTPKLEAGHVDAKFLPKVTPNGEKINLFSHSTNLNMSLNPIMLNGSVTITPKDQIVKKPTGPNAMGSTEKPWFSILPLGNPVEHQPPKTELPNTFPNDTITPQIEHLEQRLELLRSICQDEKRMPIPKSLCHGWWRLSDQQEVTDFELTLNSRGNREQHLVTLVKRNFELLHDVVKKALPEDMVLEVPEGFEDLGLNMVEDDAAEPDKKGDWNKEVALRLDKYILEQIEALEDKVAGASMQVPGWKMPSTPDIDERKFRPACLYLQKGGKINSKDEFGPDATNPVKEARERLLDLEQNIERRYLKAPLGFSNAAISLHTITSRVTATSAKARESEIKNNENKDAEDEEMEDDVEDLENDIPEKTVLPRGLLLWREGVKKAETAAQLAMAFYVLETSIAWHKSIMKAFCQLCHCGDNEDSLLLCDGCDKGYHTYCFKPSLDNIPDGDWYCFECINKASNTRHCLVCGKQDLKNIVHCSSCPRAYHTNCLSPQLSKIIAAAKKARKVPRGKWQCPGCNQKGPKKSKKSKKGPPSHLLHNADSDESPAQTNQNSPQVENATPEPEKEESAPPSPEEEEEEDNEVIINTNVQKPAPPSSGARGPKGKRKNDANSNSKTTPTAAKKSKMTKLDKDLTICHTVVSEMEALDDAWPFLNPVNMKQFPTYKKVVKKPMDIATIKKKLDSNGYKLRDEFVEDVRLIFANCEIFNEDDSPVGKAGHAMKSHFEARWTELTT